MQTIQLKTQGIREACFTYLGLHIPLLFLLWTGFCFAAGPQQLQAQAETSLAVDLKGIVITSDGLAASKAVVFGIGRQDQPGLLLNTMHPDARIVQEGAQTGPFKMQTHPVDKNSTPIIGARDSDFAVRGEKAFVADEDGVFTYPASLTSFFIQSQDGTEAAFVPPGTEFPVQLRKCAKLRINNSILSKKANVSRKGSVTVVWKNCLAGSYPLLYPPSVDGEIDPDLPPKDWRIYPYFEVVTHLDDIDLRLDCNIELLLPPGEVTVSVLTDKQRMHIEKYNAAPFIKTRHHFPSTCGISTISESSPANVALELGTCINAKVVEKEDAGSTLPNWAPGDLAYMMRFRGTPAVKLTYPEVGTTGLDVGDKYRQFQKSVPQVVKLLTAIPDGHQFRIQNQAGVYSAFVDKDGNFTTVPLPNAVYYCDVTSFLRNDEAKQSNSPGGMPAWPQKTSKRILEYADGLGAGGFLAKLQKDGNAIFKTKRNEPFFRAGEFRAVADDASQGVATTAETNNSRESSTPDGAKPTTAFAPGSPKEVTFELTVPSKTSQQDQDFKGGDELKAVIARQFDQKMKFRLGQLDDLELSLEAARKKLKTRQLQREEIIERRFRALTQENLKEQ